MCTTTRAEYTNILPIHAERQFVLPRYANEQRGFVAHYLGTSCGLSCFGIWMVQRRVT
jgi:hypothetical protein